MIGLRKKALHVVIANRAGDDEGLAHGPGNTEASQLTARRCIEDRIISLLISARKTV